MTRSAPVRLDAIDLKLLAALQCEGRLTNAALAERIGLSASPCQARMKRLEKSGLIQGYGAHLAIGKLCPHLFVFTEITLDRHQRETFIRFETAIAAEVRALECNLISGGYDYLVKFIARDILDYQECIEALLAAEVGIREYYSYVVIKPVKQSHGYPLALLTQGE